MKTIGFTFLKAIYGIVRRLILLDNNFSVELNYLRQSDVISRRKLDDALELEFPSVDDAFVGLSTSFAKREIIVLKKCILDTKSGRVFVKSDSGRLIYFESSSEWPKETILSEIEIPKKEIMQQISVGSIGLPRINYYHMTTHWLGNIIELSSQAHPIILTPYSNSLAEQIIGSYSLKVMTAETRWVEVDELSMINLGRIGYLHPTDRERIVQKRSPTSSNIKKVYISRRRSSRSLPDERIIEELLYGCGFEIIYAEDLTYAEQVRSVSSAKIIVGPHGAGMVNAIYAPPRAKIIEIMPDFRINRCIEWQSFVCSQSYTRILYDKHQPAEILRDRIMDEIEHCE